MQNVLSMYTHCYVNDSNTDAVLINKAHSPNLNSSGSSDSSTAKYVSCFDFNWNERIQMAMCEEHNIQEVKKKRYVHVRTPMHQLVWR